MIKESKASVHVRIFTARELQQRKWKDNHRKPQHVFFKCKAPGEGEPGYDSAVHTGILSIWYHSSFFFFNFKQFVESNKDPAHDLASLML